MVSWTPLDAGIALLEAAERVTDAGRGMTLRLSAAGKWTAVSRSDFVQADTPDAALEGLADLLRPCASCGHRRHEDGYCAVLVPRGMVGSGICGCGE